MTVLCSEHIKKYAFQVGFHACGIAPASPLRDFGESFEAWLSHGFDADMQYMRRNADKRANPQLLYAGARSVISVLLAYKPSHTVEGPLKFARYAYAEDYHLRIKRMLFELIELLKGEYPDFKARPFVDTAPVSDKRWAAAAGLGWIGHNTLLINRQYGSFCNIGELVTEFEADCYDKPVADGCDKCGLCVQMCPNQALRLVDGRYMLNAARCTAYNTIENRAVSIPAAQRMEGYVFGCDICQEVCPYNAATHAVFEVNDEKISMLKALFSANEMQFSETTRNTPLSRISFAQWSRNLQKACSELQKPYKCEDIGD